MTKFCCRYVRLYANSIWFSLYHRTKIFRYLIKKLTNMQMEMLTNSLRISPQCAVFCRHYFTRKRIIVTSFFVLSGALSWEPQESISPKTFNQHKHVTYDVSSNQSYEIKSPLWTIWWFRILGIVSVENIDSWEILCFKLQTIVSCALIHSTLLNSWLLSEVWYIIAPNLS